MMIEKDEEIENLQAKVNSLLNKIPNNQLDSEKDSIDQLKSVNFLNE